MRSRLPTIFFGLILPFVLVIGCFPFYNKVEPRIFGFPFIYAWIFACFGLISLCMLVAWKLDPLSDANKKKFAEQQKRQD